jgi:hypothetical protein
MCNSNVHDWPVCHTIVVLSTCHFSARRITWTKLGRLHHCWSRTHISSQLNMLPVGTREATRYCCTSAARDSVYRGQQSAVTVALCTFRNTEQRHLLGLGMPRRLCQPPQLQTIARVDQPTRNAEDLWVLHSRQCYHVEERAYPSRSCPGKLASVRLLSLTFPSSSFTASLLIHSRPRFYLPTVYDHVGQWRDVHHIHPFRNFSPAHVHPFTAKL